MCQLEASHSISCSLLSSHITVHILSCCQLLLDLVHWQCEQVMLMCSACLLELEGFYLYFSLSQVFEAMITWIKHDKEARLEHMPKLMEHVRLPLLSRDYLVQVGQCTTCCDCLFAIYFVLTL